MKWRLMAAFIAVTLLMLLVQDVPLSTYLRTVERDRIITSLERDAFVLAGRSEEALESAITDDDAGLAALARTYRDAGGARVVIVNTAGTAIATSDDDQSSIGSDYASRPEITGALGGQIMSGSRYSDTLQVELLYVTVPVFSGDEVYGAVRLTYPEQVVDDAVNDQIRMLGIVALTTVLLAGIVGYIFSTSVTRRLKLLKDATERLSSGDLSARADESGGAPELRSLSRSFNIMAERLDTLLQEQRRFAADASHQLRTPLTALRLKLERAGSLVSTDPAGAAVRLAAAEAEADRLGTIVEGLLLLSRTEGRSAPLMTVDLAEIARERVEQWQALAQESAVTIRYDGPLTASVSAVSTAVEQILDNYVDNALSVSPGTSTIIVRVTSAVPVARVDRAVRQLGPAPLETVQLEVLDEGPGLSVEDCSRAFDRFWRARSDSAGSGLGLAIVAQLAKASRATVALAPRGTGGLAASATFTAAGPAREGA
ncbi:ATP-binding protein [Cryobacterium luteum]|uniref:histidine kinase n=1 Tax=Cryobacterium luteum TaxID=1424661 RepID=A0A1H8AN18_9MICO|nr:ATP-binding protein [Cryobacterium luteum]TFB88579.1 HAMP domain-containing protein [Cryobacterium luteum]SEM72140.1 Signal transduction histidine kinase [Cryobacterium luteum]